MASASATASFAADDRERHVARDSEVARTDATNPKLLIHPVADDGYTYRAAWRFRDLVRQATPTWGGRVVTQAATADVILVIARADGDPTMSAVRHDPVYRQWRSKCVVYCEHDNPVPWCPGWYAGLGRRGTALPWVRSAPYVQKLRDSRLPYAALDHQSKYLYSFVGSMDTHPVRRLLLGLNDPEAHLEDTSNFVRRCRVEGNPDKATIADYHRRYDQVIQDSAFLLCPRGVAPGSVRFFETLRAGRVPVLLSDDWELPAGPSWDEFVVRVPEGEAKHLPDIIRERRGEARRRGELARQAWENFFSPAKKWSSLHGTSGREFVEPDGYLNWILVARRWGYDLMIALRSSLNRINHDSRANNHA